MWILSVSMNTYENIRLTAKTQYGVVEIVDDNDKLQKYAVVLTLNDYYVLEPITENGDEMTINTEWYLYKRKDNFKVYQKHYMKVFTDNYSTKAISELKEKYYK